MPPVAEENINHGVLLINNSYITDKAHRSKRALERPTTDEAERWSGLERVNAGATEHRSIGEAEHWSSRKLERQS